MKLFEMKDWKLTISEEAYSLIPFKNIIDSDKSKDKELAIKELAFIWHYTDIKSDFQYLINDKEREQEVASDVGLDIKKWKKSKLVDEAVAYYKKRSTTVSSTILDNSLFIANTLSNKMRKLVESDDLSIADIEKVSKGLAQMPNIVSSLEKLQTSVVKQQTEQSSKVGSKDKNIFEDGIF